MLQNAWKPNENEIVLKRQPVEPDAQSEQDDRPVEDMSDSPRFRMPFAESVALPMRGEPHRAAHNKEEKWKDQPRHADPPLRNLPRRCRRREQGIGLLSRLIAQNDHQQDDHAAKDVE